MRIVKTKGIYEIHFTNGHFVGTIEYDPEWRIWYFIPNKQGVKLSKHYLKDIYKFIRRLR